MKKHTNKKALEVKLQKIRELTAQKLGVVVGGAIACGTGTGCGCTRSAEG